MRLPRPRPWVQYAQLTLAVGVSGVLGWVLVAGAARAAWPVDTAAFTAVLAGACVLVLVVVAALFRVLVIRYWTTTPGQHADLQTTTLHHYTTRHAAAEIMGVAGIPPAGVTGTAQLLTGQPGALTAVTALTGGRTAVFAWTGPLAHPGRHLPTCDAVITFSGADLPDPGAVRWHPNGALRIAGGYHGPATAHHLQAP